MLVRCASLIKHPPMDKQAAPNKPEGRPACHLIVHNVSKKHNVGTLVRSATAFGVKQVCLVGSNQFNTFGSHGSANHMSFTHFFKLPDCVQHLKGQGCQIIGVEIADTAKPVQTHPFSGPTAFLLGNEGTGLSAAQMALCDSFVYVPQHGEATASLNVAVAASIVLHHFAVWAGMPEAPRDGFKYHVAQPPQRTTPRGIVPPSPDVLRAERALRKARAGDAAQAIQGVEVENTSGGVETDQELPAA